MKGLGFKHHGNDPCNHGSHYGNHHGNYHDNHSNHHGSYHAEQLLFSCQFSKVSSCQVVRLCAYHVYSTASNLAIRSQTMHTGIKPSCIGTFRIYVRTERKSAKEFNIIFR